MKPAVVVDYITLCHGDGHSYKEITVSTTGDWEGHLNHYLTGKDIYPIPEGGCPTSTHTIPTMGVESLLLMASLLLVIGIRRLT